MCLEAGGYFLLWCMEIGELDVSCDLFDFNYIFLQAEYAHYDCTNIDDLCLVSFF